MYAINFGPTYTDSDNQDSLDDTAFPLPSPQRVVPLEPDQIVKSNGLKVENGPFGWQLFWDELSPTELETIFDKTGGENESSIFGYIRIWDRKPRSSSESWAVYTCVLDQPVKPEYRAGPSRYNVMVAARNLVVYELLP